MAQILQVLRDAKLYWITTMSLQLAGFLTAVIGFSVPNHLMISAPGFESLETNVGIWQYCVVRKWESCEPSASYFSRTKHGLVTLHTTQTLTSLSLVLELMVIALTVNTLWPVIQYKWIAFLKSGLALLSGLFGLIGVNLSLSAARKIAKKYFIYDYYNINRSNANQYYNVKVEAVAGWGFYLFLYGQIAYLVCDLIHIVHARKPSHSGNARNSVKIKLLKETTDQQSTV